MMAEFYSGKQDPRHFYCACSLTDEAQLVKWSHVMFTCALYSLTHHNVSCGGKKDYL